MVIINDPRAREFLSGLLSAMISISITFPITKLIYRQVLENSPYKNSLKRMRKEGFRNLYRGITPPLFQRSMEISSMFGVYKTAELALHPLKLSMYDEKVASSVISGVVESVLTPFERTQLLLIDSQHNKRFRNVKHIVTTIIRDYGPKEFLRGYTLILLRNICHNTFFFLMKDEMSGLTKCHKTVPINIQNFLIGSSVGLMMTSLFYPLKVIKVNMQKQLGGEFKSIFATARSVYNHERRGLRNFYIGLRWNIVRAMLAWGVTNLSYEFIRKNIS